MRLRRRTHTQCGFDENQPGIKTCFTPETFKNTCFTPELLKFSVLHLGVSNFKKRQNCMTKLETQGLFVKRRGRPGGDTTEDKPCDAHSNGLLATAVPKCLDGVQKGTWSSGKDEGSGVLMSGIVVFVQNGCLKCTLSH